MLQAATPTLVRVQVENPLAQRILRGEFGPGDTIRVTAEGDVIDFTRAREAA